MKNWKWFGNASHFICGQQCRFHLCTQVGGYLVSTVGQYWPERAVREIHAKVTDPKWFSRNVSLMGDAFDAAYMKRFGYEEIGFGRTFETMVFKVVDPCNGPDCKCGLPEISGTDLDFDAYTDAGSANAGHLKMCLKWSRKRKPADIVLTEAVP